MMARTRGVKMMMGTVMNGDTKQQESRGARSRRRMGVGKAEHYDEEGGAEENCVDDDNKGGDGDNGDGNYDGEE